MSDVLQPLMSFLQNIFGHDVDWKQVFLIGMTPLFLLAFMIEFAVEKKRGHGENFHGKEVLANLSLGGSYLVFDAIMWVVLTGGIFAWVFDHRLFDIPVNGWTILPIFIGVEFSYYWFHRTSHRVRWFWTAHVPHHSGETMNFTNAMRQSLLNAFVGSFVFYLPMVWLGVPPAVVLFCLAVDLAYQYFVHTESIGRFPKWYEYIFDTPSNHRVHHGSNTKYLDKNMGMVFIIWDRLFGTYQDEEEEVRYGLTTNLENHHPANVVFHEWKQIWKDVASAPTLYSKFMYIFGPPGWSHDGSRKTSRQLRKELNT